jgi:hypothetical protein
MTSERGKMTDDRLKEIKERLEKATPGKWRADRNTVDFGPPTGSPFAVLHSDADPSNTTNDADFIAHSREDIPYLLAEIERLKQLIGKSASMGRGILTILGQAEGAGE